MQLGIPLATALDLAAVRSLVRQLADQKQRPLTGVEVGPWLGRTTLAILAPDLQLSDPLPGDDVVWRLLQNDYTNIDAVRAAVESLRFEGDMIPLIKLHLNRLLSIRIHPKRKVFGKLAAIDTWQGIDTEKHLFFREHNPKEVFLRNIWEAGFSDVVVALEGKASDHSFHLNKPVDFVFIDGSHEHLDVVRDLFAVRNALGPDSILCGHDIALTDRWPGVRSAVENHVRDYVVDQNVWIATATGVGNLLSAPPYAQIHEHAERVDAEERRRYESSSYRRRWGLP